MNYDEKYTEYQVNRSKIRFFIRSFYIKNILRFVIGRSIDFGCGSGDLLKKLPEGSMGTDINQFSINYCRENSLNVIPYIIENDKYQLNIFNEGVYDTIIFSHVLEHIGNAKETIKTLFTSILRLNIKRIIIIVPGIKGFLYDNTHKTYIDFDYIYKNNLEKLCGYEIIYKKYYPFNSKLLSKYFTHNELIMVYDKISK
jgi:2-polyprenyl-3-methyl-5-hydroxy-6-metoxy-1,4-benzoquinol methylase